MKWSFRSMIFRDRNIRLMHLVCSISFVVFVNYIHNVCTRRAIVLTGHDAVIDEVNRWVRCHRSNCKRITIPRHEYSPCVSYTERLTGTNEYSLRQRQRQKERERDEFCYFSLFFSFCTCAIIHVAIESRRISDMKDFKT